MSTTRKIRVGDRVEHKPSGDYLGVVIEVMKSGVRFDGPRKRDGHPVTFACNAEVRRCS